MAVGGVAVVGGAKCNVSNCYIIVMDAMDCSVHVMNAKAWMVYVVA